MKESYKKIRGEVVEQINRLEKEKDEKLRKKEDEELKEVIKNTKLAFGNKGYPYNTPIFYEKISSMRDNDKRKFLNSHLAQINEIAKNGNYELALEIAIKLGEKVLSGKVVGGLCEEEKEKYAQSINKRIERIFRMAIKNKEANLLEPLLEKVDEFEEKYKEKFMYKNS